MISDLHRVVKCRGVSLRGGQVVGGSPHVVLSYDTVTGKFKMSTMTELLRHGKVGGCVMSVNNRMIMENGGSGVGT